MLYGEDVYVPEIPVNDEGIPILEYFTDEDISPRVLEILGIDVEDVVTYQPKIFSIYHRHFWEVERYQRTIDIIITKTGDENMIEINIYIDGLGWGHLEKN